MKYNLTQIMTSAWTIRRTENLSMSASLKKSWAQAKRQPICIKGWFMTKNFTASERIAIAGTEPSVAAETEKALKLRWETSYGIIICWVPKSCLETAEATEAERKAALDAYNARQSRYEALIAECRAHGIPARKGWTASTMREKLAALAA